MLVLGPIATQILIKELLSVSELIPRHISALMGHLLLMEYLLLIDTPWTLPQSAGCARSAPDQGQRLVLVGSSSLNNRHRALKCVLNVFSSNLYHSGYQKMTTDACSIVPEVAQCARNGPN